MTDLQFMERLRQDLATPPQWADLRGGLGPIDDPSVGPNESRVFPPSAADARGHVSVLRQLVKWETAPADRVGLPQE